MSGKIHQSTSVQQETLLNTPICERSRIFSDNTFAVGLIFNEFFQDKLCIKCNSKLTLQKRRLTKVNHVLRCSSTLCRKVHPFYFFSCFKGISVPVNDILYIIYKWIKNSFIYDIVNETNYTKKTILRILKILQEEIKENSANKTLKFGGEGKVIQVDETAISRKGKIRNPTSSIENSKKTMWLLGFIEEDNKKNFELVILKNRKISTIYEAMKPFVEENTLIKSDGHPSYPEVAKLLNCKHLVVNHQEGFCNKDGVHTNIIENLWSCLKSDTSKKHGVLRKKMDLFLHEWKWKRKNINKKEKENFQNAFLKVLEILFK